MEAASSGIAETAQEVAAWRRKVPIAPVAGAVLLGTQGWNYSAWVGPFYPEGTRPADYLAIYARAFATVEVDSTFYAVPSEKTVRGWASRVPDRFAFALKMPREITHDRQLEGCAERLAQFVERLRLLGPKLGPVLMQFGPGFGPEKRERLEAFLALLPGDIRFAVEFRRGRWLGPDLLDLLRTHRVALTLTDGPWVSRERMIALAAHPTTDFAYVRWMGPDRAIEDYSRVVADRQHELGMWAVGLAALAARVTVVYGYFNNHFQGHSPASARAMQSLLGQHSVAPADLADQTELF
jgi:uncharacterized protein YecE (DUF72 family)